MNKGSVSYWKTRIFQAEFSTPDGEKTTASNWTMRCSHAGKQRKVTLPSANKDEAARLAADFFGTLKRTGRWEEALKEIGRVPEALPAQNAPESLPGTLTVGGWIQTVEGLQVLNPRTLQGYAYALRWLGREHLGLRGSNQRFNHKGGGTARWREQINAVPLESLTPARVQFILDEYIRREGKNPKLKKRAANSVRSFVRNARALFSRPLLQRLRKLEPCPIPPQMPANPFADLQLPEVGAMRYVSNVSLPDLLGAARRELREAKPAVWIAFLLGACAGLRRREIDALGWDQVRFDKASIWVRSSEDFEAKTPGSEAEVFIDATLLEELRWWKERPDAPAKFVLPGLEAFPKPGFGWRCDSTVFRPLLDWLRAHGLDEDKPLHTLRKEFGSFVAEHADIYAAQRQLRHSQISTTAMYYAENRKRIAPAIPAIPAAA